MEHFWNFRTGNLKISYKFPWSEDFFLAGFTNLQLPVTKTQDALFRQVEQAGQEWNIRTSDVNVWWKAEPHLEKVSRDMHRYTTMYGVSIPTFGQFGGGVVVKLDHTLSVWDSSSWFPLGFFESVWGLILPGCHCHGEFVVGLCWLDSVG